MVDTSFPPWAEAVLDPAALPGPPPPGGWPDGILEVSRVGEDPSISWYESRGGSRFQERSQVPFTMTSLDTPQYHAWLRAWRPDTPDAVVVDVGAGDGRNALPYLHAGQHRVVAVEPVRAALERLRRRAREEGVPAPLLVRGEARRLPLRSGTADLVLCVESLYYLNEEYEKGLAECVRVLRPGGRLLLSERTREGALLTALLYGGVGEFLRVAGGRSLWEGPAGNRVRSRYFTEPELRAVVGAAGLDVVEVTGLSMLSLVLGYLRGQGAVTEEDAGQLPGVVEVLRELGPSGGGRRTHLVVARRP